MAGVTVDSVIVSLEARVAKYQTDLVAATKQTQDAFAKMRRAAKEPITPKLGAPQQAGAEAAAVEKSEARKQTARKKTAKTEEDAQARIAAVIQRTIERDNARTASALSNSNKRTAAFNKELAAQQTRLMASTSLGSGNTRAPDRGLSFDDVRADIAAQTARSRVSAASGDKASAQALKDQQLTLRLINQYKKEGLSASDALKRAEEQIAAATRRRATQEEAAARAKVEQSLRRNQASIGSGIQAAAASIIGGVGIAEISALNDKYIEFTNRLKVAGVEGKAQKDVQDALFASAQRYGVELGSLASVFTKATEAGREYGATQQQNIQFTNAVAAAVKVQGGSVESARGALLQLGQALQSGTVRAEEFNSLMEGLFPILQAAAGASDKYGGSVAKLRAAVIEGTLTSQEFFNLILKGSAALEQRAGKATLTTAAGFTTLSNALVVYFGEADKANGVSAALGEVFNKIARKLDTIISAITAVAAAYATYTAGVAIATGATTAFGAALALLERHPVIIALTAIAGGLTYLTLTSDNAAASVGTFSNSLKDSESNLKAAEDRARDAGVAIDKIGTNAAASAKNVDKLALSLSQAAHQSATLAAQEKIRALQDIASRRRGLERERQNLLDDANPGRAARLTKAVVGDQDSFVQGQRRLFDSRNQLNTNTAALRQNTQAMNNLNREEAVTVATPTQAFVSPAGVAGGGSPVETAKQKRAREVAERKAESARKRAEREAERAQRDQARDETQDRQMQIEVLRARSALTDNVQERADFELQRLAIEKAQRVADVNSDKTLSAQERAARLKYIETLYGPVNTDPNSVSVGAGGLLQRGVDKEAQRQLEQDASEIADRLNSIQEERLRDELDAASTREERSRIQNQLLELEIQEREAALKRQRDEAIRQGKSTEGIDAQIAALGGVRSRGQDAIARDNEGPLAARLRQLGGDNIQDAVENGVLQQLQQVEDGITSAIQGAIGVKNPILDALIRGFIQEQLIKPLLSAFSSGTGGYGINNLLGGIGGAIGGIFRASGGNVVAGQAYRVNEGGNSGRVEGFVPAQSGKIIPLGRMNMAGGGGAVINQTVKVDARNSVNPDGFARQILTISAQQAQAAASTAARATYQAIPQRINEFNKDGI